MTGSRYIPSMMFTAIRLLRNPWPPCALWLPISRYIRTSCCSCSTTTLTTDPPHHIGMSSGLSSTSGSDQNSAKGVRPQLLPNCSRIFFIFDLKGLFLTYCQSKGWDLCFQGRQVCSTCVTLPPQSHHLPQILKLSRFSWRFTVDAYFSLLRKIYFSGQKKFFFWAGKKILLFGGV